MPIVLLYSLLYSLIVILRNNHLVFFQSYLILYLDWKDSPVLTESLEHAYEEFARCTTLKVQNDEGLIIGSVNGNVTDGSLYIGRLMVLSEYQQQGIGKQLFREIQSRLPHNRAWLCTCQQIRPPYEFYLREGFKPYKSEEVGPGLTWAYLEK